MSYSHTYKSSLVVGSESIPNPPSDSDLTLTGTMQTRLAETIPGGSTNLLLNIAIDASEVASLFIHADRDMTIKTNSSSTPDVTISLKADRPLQYDPDGYLTDPLEGDDVTKIYVTLAAGADSVLTIEVLQDSTP